MISPEKQNALTTKMISLEILEHDLLEKFIQGSGSGGQKINKTSSCVYLKHLPSGIEIKCQKERSREMNRYFARKELCDKIDQIKNGELSKKQQATEKIRRQKRQKSRRQKQRMVADKLHHGKIKSLRKNISSE